MRAGMLLCALLASWAAHADSWVARYAQLRPEVQRACDAHDLLTCHAGLLELAHLLDDRQDVLYKLARVEAELGLTQLALRRAPLVTLVEPGNLGSPQTPALTGDGSTLLVPDYQRGIARVSLRRHSVSWLQRPSELALFGIDGMYLEGRMLVAIQNGTVPERIVVIRLNRTFERVDSWRVLLARAPGLGDPTHGCLRHGEFFFIANSGWDQFEDDGARVAGVVPTAPEIWRISPGVPTQNR